MTEQVEVSTDVIERVYRRNSRFALSKMGGHLLDIQAAAGGAISFGVADPGKCSGVSGNAFAVTFRPEHCHVIADADVARMTAGMLVGWSKQLHDIAAALLAMPPGDGTPGLNAFVVKDAVSGDVVGTALTPDEAGQIAVAYADVVNGDTVIAFDDPNNHETVRAEIQRLAEEMAIDIDLLDGVD